MRNKTQRFEDNKISENVIEPDKEIYEKIKGFWNKSYFKNDNPIAVEIGCGNGNYTVSYAKEFPNKNIIGIDIKGARIWNGSQKSKELKNICFLRTRIELIENFFSQNEINEINITFPDPRPRKKDIKKRLISYRFINIYRKICFPNTFVHFKTDNENLFDFALETLDNEKISPIYYTYDLHKELSVQGAKELDKLKKINSLYNTFIFHRNNKTDYEKRFVNEGLRIKYLVFKI